MRLPLLRLLLLALPVILGAAASSAAGRQDDAAIEQRIRALLARMTLPEKVAQLHLAGRADPPPPQLELIRQGRIGVMMNIPTAREIELYRAAAAQSRLRIPLMFGLDAVNVFRLALPAPIAWAASWSAEVAEDAAFRVGSEAAAVGINWTFAPAVDLSRDPRWGRVIEGAGEDPYLASVMAGARVRGYRRGGLATAVKHFVGYGFVESGKDYGGATMSTGDLFDLHLRPFKAALEAGSETVMAAFNTVNGMPASADRYLLTDVLRKRWGFNGFVTSDYGAINELIRHGIAADSAEAGRKALHAGLDLDMESYSYINHLEADVKAGRVPAAELDTAVLRILRTKARLGLFETIDTPVAARPVDESAMRATARRTARESFVLLKNDDDVLPLTPAYKRIALIGAWAQTDDDGSWFEPAELTKAETPTLYAAFKSRLSPGQTLTFAPGFTEKCGHVLADPEGAVAVARDADVVVLVVAEDCDISGEGTSRTNLNLSGAQQELLQRISRAGKPIVLLVNTGRPLTLTESAPLAKAVLIVWQGGTEGRNAIAEVAFGAYPPSGKLPMTFPRSVGQIPIYYNHLPTGRPPANDRYTSRYMDEEVTPLYPFGWGLSYTTFAYTDLVVETPRPHLDDVVRITVTLTNTGTRAGTEVAQLYTRQPVASRSRPVRELRRFVKVTLAPGESRKLAFELPVQELGFHDDQANYLVEPGRYQVFVGGNALADLATDFVAVP